MTDDLIARLKGHSEIMERDKGKFVRFIDVATCTEAADRIEELATEAAENARIIGMSAEREMALRGEVERLREALEAVVWCDSFGVMDGLLSNGCEHGFKPASKCPNDQCEDANIERKIRAALEGTSDGDLSDIAPDAKSESVDVSDVVASHPATSTPVVSHKQAETSDNDLVERVAQTLGIALARDVERDVYAAETCIEERRCIAASLLPIIAEQRETAARAALEAARDAVEGYMADCLDDKDVQRQWPRTFSRNLIYGKLVRTIDPAAFRGGDDATGK